jgi:hypothetical protein
MSDMPSKEYAIVKGFELLSETVDEVEKSGTIPVLVISVSYSTSPAGWGDIGFHIHEYYDNNRLEQLLVTGLERLRELKLSSGQGGPES